VKDFVAEYGQVIVDECHHLSAFTFEQVFEAGEAKYCCRIDSKLQNGKMDIIHHLYAVRPDSIQAQRRQ